MKTPDFGYMPFMVVNHMFHNHLTGIELALFFVACGLLLLFKRTVACSNQNSFILKGGSDTTCKKYGEQKAQKQTADKSNTDFNCCHETTYNT